MAPPGAETPAACLVYDISDVGSVSKLPKSVEARWEPFQKSGSRPRALRQAAHSIYEVSAPSCSVGQCRIKCAAAGPLRSRAAAGLGRGYG
jgi:hypothetical protein